MQGDEIAAHGKTALAGIDTLEETKAKYHVNNVDLFVPRVGYESENRKRKSIVAINEEVGLSLTVGCAGVEREGSRLETTQIKRKTMFLDPLYQTTTGGIILSSIGLVWMAEAYLGLLV